MYNEEDFLQISGIQHFKFCRRQWALIHIENQWDENFRTTDGEIFHSVAHDSSHRETRGDKIITRDMRVFSPTLGISGACDVVELHLSDKGIVFPGLPNKYEIFPVEYKRGSPRDDTSNSLQLCAQAMCLEEMLCCDIPVGALYYGEIKRRQTIAFTEELRQEVREIVSEMHQYYSRGYTPKCKPTKSCNACSLKDICLPKLMRNKSVDSYIGKMLEE